jgi:hypothetical protein
MWHAWMLKGRGHGLGSELVKYFSGNFIIDDTNQAKAKGWQNGIERVDERECLGNCVVEIHQLDTK